MVLQLYYVLCRAAIVVVVVSTRGIWMAHFWEYDSIATSDELFVKEVLDPVRKWR